MKKGCRILFYSLVVVLLGGVLLEGGLHMLSRTRWFKDRVTAAVENALGREVTLARMGANLRGVFIEDVKVAEKGGFSQGIFAQLGRLQVRISLIHLLHGHVKIQALILSDMHVNLVMEADGTANWEDWTSAPGGPNTPSSAERTSLAVSAARIRLERLNITFTDYKTSRTLAAQGVNLEINNFSLQKEFSVSFWANFHHKEKNFERTIPLRLHARVNLHQLDLAHAYVLIRTFKATYQKSFVELKGNVRDFINPQVNLEIALHHFSSGLFEDVINLPAFSCKKATGVLAALWDSQQQRVTLQQAAFEAPGLALQAKGELSYAKALSYQFAVQGTALLDELGRWFTALADPYRLMGKLTMQAHVTQQKLTAQVDFTQVGGWIAQAGHFSDITGRLAGWETTDLKTGNLEASIDGKLEAEPFSIALSAQQTLQKIVAQLKARAKQWVWRSMPDVSGTPEPQPQPEGSAQPGWRLPPIELQADLDVEKLDVPYFYGTHIQFDADMQGLTPDLKQAHGVLRLRTEDGKIQDIYKLTDANALTQVLFMSLNLTGKVFNTLNVFGVLKGLGGTIVSAVSGNSSQAPLPVKTQTVLGPEGEPIEITVVESEQKIEGEMPYDKFDTQVNFQNGQATVKQGTFVSSMMSLRLDGKTDFNTGIVDFTVHAAPGRHEVDGMLPLTIKIGGTVQDPQGNMQLLGSVTSLVTQTVANNVVSRHVTKGIKGFFGLFKKDEPAPSTQ